MSMEGIKNKLIMAFIISSIFSCRNHEQTFTKEKWFISDDEGYPYRSSMVDDLIKNHLDMCGHEIIKLLGDPTVIESRRNYHEYIYYYIETKNSMNIDPYYSKYLELKIDQDSCVIDSNVTSIK